mmetsp:Transcript_10674/g.20410  ORF Transcript_10674/g.20410 Transcript_10674/m.20410 type:complete len:84 (-) Transcript_10674:448-699(-)
MGLAGVISPSVTRVQDLMVLYSVGYKPEVSGTTCVPENDLLATTKTRWLTWSLLTVCALKFVAMHGTRLYKQRLRTSFDVQST